MKMKGENYAIRNALENFFIKARLYRFFGSLSLGMFYKVMKI
jgi:hypothetical protein